MRRGPGLFSAAVTALALLFLHAPVLVLIVFSFDDSRFGAGWQGFTLRWYRRLFEREDILHALRNSLIVGAVATVVSTLLGTLLALGLARHRTRARSAIDGLLHLPLVTPEIVVGISLLILFAAIGLPLGLTTIAIAHVAFCISFVVIVVGARLQGMDRHLEEAAASLGADEWATFWKVTLPQLWPGVIAGALLAFTLSIDDFVITFFVSGPGSTTLPVLVYSMVRKAIEPSINAISAILVLTSTLLVVIADRFIGAARRREEGRRWHDPLTGG